MNTYNVTIKAEVYKTIMVEAANENEAYVAAHELFTVSPDGFWPEKYNEETIDIKLLPDAILRP